MSEAAALTTKCYCNQLAIQRGLDPVGTAGSFSDSIVIETPLPWRNDLYQVAGALPQQAIDLLTLWAQRYREGQPYNHRPLMIVPAAAYSRPGFRRVLYYERPADLFARFEKREYLVPEAEAGALIWALYEAPDDLAHFDAYRQDEANTVRDLLVCTHGSIDAACAKFGYPLYRYLRDHHADERLRVWRVSHFGGHVFAPTLIDMPTGHSWAYIEQAQADQLVASNGSVAALRGHYRGWSGVADGFLQAAEREIWQREGWRWFEYPKRGEILTQDTRSPQPEWADIRIDFTTPTGSAAYEARVEICKTIETEHSTHYANTLAYPQYQITRLEKRFAQP